MLYFKKCYHGAAINDYPSDNLKGVIKNINQTRLEALRFAENVGWETIGGNSSPFLWVRIPERKQSVSYSTALLRRKRILTLPGTAFGETGDGYLRLSLTASIDDYKEAGERMSKKFTIRSSIKKSGILK